MMENHQCGSSCGCGISHGYSGACVCGSQMSHGGSSCGCGMSHGHRCGYGSADPMEQAKKLLQSAFFIALKEVHVEKIKKIIERDWGDNIDKAAELAVKAVEKQWQVSLSTSFASKEFEHELREILTSKGK